MKKPNAKISESSYGEASDISIGDGVIGITLTNEGAETVEYGWGSENYNRTLLPGASRSFGGFTDFNIGGNQLFWRFTSGANEKKFIITKFTGIC